MVFGFLKGLFQERMLSKKRVHSLTEFRKMAVQALGYLINHAKSDYEKGLYILMKQNVHETKLIFHAGHSLSGMAKRVGNSLVYGVTKGEHVNQIQLVQKGKSVFLIRNHYINLPADHIFDGERLSFQGLITLSHEYAHFPKRNLRGFANHFGVDMEQSEELIADMLAARLAKTLGFKEHDIIRHFDGREIVYLGFPLREFIKRAVS